VVAVVVEGATGSSVVEGAASSREMEGSGAGVVSTSGRVSTGAGIDSVVTVTGTGAVVGTAEGGGGPGLGESTGLRGSPTIRNEQIEGARFGKKKRETHLAIWAQDILDPGAIVRLAALGRAGRPQD